MTRQWTFQAAGIALVAGAGVHAIAYLAGPRWMAFLGASLVVLACYCFFAARGTHRLPLQRPVLALAAAVFLARGLLVLPVVLAGTRAWMTPLGRFVVTGPIAVFIAGSIVVLAIGSLIAGGLLAAASSRRRMQLSAT